LGFLYSVELTLKKEEEWFVATCLENNIASQGKTIDEATENLKEAIALYYEDETEKALPKKEVMQNIQMETIPQLFRYMILLPEERLKVS